MQKMKDEVAQAKESEDAMSRDWQKILEKKAGDDKVHEESKHNAIARMKSLQMQLEAMEVVREKNDELRSEMSAAGQLIKHLEEDFHALCKNLKALQLSDAQVQFEVQQAVAKREVANKRHPKRATLFKQAQKLISDLRSAMCALKTSQEHAKDLESRLVKAEQDRAAD